jgi:hypothetical protein
MNRWTGCASSMSGTSGAAGRKSKVPRVANGEQQIGAIDLLSSAVAVRLCDEGDEQPCQDGDRAEDQEEPEHDREKTLGAEESTESISRPIV